MPPAFLPSHVEALHALAFPLGCAAAFRVGAAAAVINQPRVPVLATDIPYQIVGSRICRLPSVSSEGATVRCRIFYPAATSTATIKNGLKEAAYCTEGRQTSDAMAGLVGFRQLGMSFLLAHLAEASSGCLLNAPLADEGKDGFPLLVYSHGYGGNMDMATYFMR